MLVAIAAACLGPEVLQTWTTHGICSQMWELSQALLFSQENYLHLAASPTPDLPVFSRDLPRERAVLCHKRARLAWSPRSWRGPRPGLQGLSWFPAHPCQRRSKHSLCSVNRTPAAQVLAKKLNSVLCDHTCLEQVLWL